MLTLKNLHILVVEDLDPMRKLISHCLKMLDVGEISTAKNGADGYELYKRGKPDIIITDWVMPEMTGIEMVRKIRRSPNSPQKDIPIIMMTGYCAKERIVEALENGINSFLIKPFSAKDVSKRIAHIINNPPDFVITDKYAGPEREEHKNEKAIQRIKANTGLKIKAGSGTVSDGTVEKAQKVINNNKIDFIPIATNFIIQLSESIEQAKAEQKPGRRSIERIIHPIMQIKANARIFKHEILGDVADIILDFLEKINDVDEFVIQIADANQKTLRHLVSGKQKEELEKDSDSLIKELEGAFSRYLNVKYKMSQSKLKKAVG